METIFHNFSRYQTTELVDIVFYCIYLILKGYDDFNYSFLLCSIRDDTILDDEIDEPEFNFDNENEDALLAETEYDFVEATEVCMIGCSDCFSLYYVQVMINFVVC